MLSGDWIGYMETAKTRYSREGENVSETLQRLVILHTNDIHSHFEPMPKIASCIEQHRRELPEEELLVIDCGDHLDRAFSETEGSDGLANIAVMNMTGYDLAVLGNNEGLTFSMEKLQRLYGEEASFPVIGTNMFKLDDGERPDWVQPYQIIQRGKLKIGIIGVTINFTEFYTLLGWDIRDPKEAVARLVRELRDEVHILIVVSHLGLPADEQMAREIAGIDCILGAHTHHLLEVPLTIGQTTVCGAGKFGTHVGKLELIYDHEARQIAHVHGLCIETADMPNHPELARLIDHYRTVSTINLHQVMTTIEAEIAIDWHQESRLGNLLALGLREWCDAEIGIVNAGQLLGGLAAGDITRGKLLEICPSPINPCRMKLYGSDIREALEQSLLPEYQEMPIRGFGFRGNILGTLCVSGLQIEVSSNLANRQIERILLNGKELEDDQEVIVGTIDMFTFNIGYPSLSRGRDVKFYLPEFLRDVLLDQLQRPGRVALSGEITWITPDE